MKCTWERPAVPIARAHAALRRRSSRRAPFRATGLVSGVYVHGLFAEDQQRAAWLRRLGAEPSLLRYEARIEETLDALAEHCARHLDLDRLLEFAR